MKTNFIPSPGTYIAEEIADDSPVLLGVKGTRIAKGKVVAVGAPEITEFGVTIFMPVKIGDIAHFISYEGNYDNEKIDGKKYFTILRKDHRFVTE